MPLIEMPKIEPDEPDTVDADAQQVIPADFAPRCRPMCRPS